MKLARLSFLGLLVVLGSETLVWSQEAQISSGNRVSGKSIKRLFRSSGWNIPERSAKPFGDSIDIEIGGIPVQIEAFKPNEDLTDLEEYYSPSESRIRIILGKYRVGTIFVYSVDTKPFAMQVSYSPAVVTDFRIEASSASILILYIDDDGDGIFEERIQTTALPTIPKWLR